MDFVDVKQKLIWTLLFLGILLILATILNNYALNPNISSEYTNFYQTNLSYAAWGMLLIMIGFNLMISDKIAKVLKFGILHKSIIFFGFFFAMMFMTFFGGQIVGVPKASIGEFALTQGDEIMTSSVIPGYVEDGLYLIAIPYLILAIMLLFHERFFGDVSIPILIIFMLVSSGIGGTIFTAAHVQTYGELQDAYLGAWIFGSGQSFVYQLTGWYLPLTHIVHNAVIAVGDLYGISIGQFQIT